MHMGITRKPFLSIYFIPLLPNTTLVDSVSNIGSIDIKRIVIHFSWLLSDKSKWG
jgi:hypothetical protein